MELSYDADHIKIGVPSPVGTIRPAGPRSFYDAMPDGQRFLIEVPVDPPVFRRSVNVVHDWPALLKKAD